MKVILQSELVFLGGPECARGLGSSLKLRLIDGVSVNEVTLPLSKL